MKNILKIYSMLLFCFAVLCSCEKEDDTFIGTDNYMTSFSLEKNGVKYIGAITDGVIEVTVPANTDLSGFEADYEICELAVISPEPESISDWNIPQIFTVTSYNKEYREYSYSVKYGDAEPFEGDVQLFSQADADTFAAKCPEIINGNLIIGKAALPEDGDDVIKSLDGLATIKKVTGNIVVNRGAAYVNNFSGLQNVEYAGGLYVGSEESAAVMENEVELNFANLSKVAGEVVVNAEVSAIKLPVLKEAMKVFVKSAKATEVELSSLEQVYGHVTFTQVKGVADLSLPSLENIDGDFILNNSDFGTVSASALKTIGRNMTWSAAANIESVEFPVLEQIGGAVAFSSMANVAKMAMPALKSMGTININNLPGLEEVNFDALEQVNEGQLRISGASALKTLDLNSLKSVCGQLYLYQLNSLASVKVPAIEECAEVYMYKLPLVESLDFSTVDSISKINIIQLESLKSVKASSKVGTLTINAASQVIDVPEIEGDVIWNMEFTGLKNSSLEIKGFANNIKNRLSINSSYVTEFSMPDIETVGVLYVSTSKCVEFDCPKLKKASKIEFFGGSMTKFALPALEECADFIFETLQTSGSLETLSLPSLVKVTNFEIGTVTNDMVVDIPLLKKIEGTLTVMPMSSYYGRYMGITNLNGFSNITEIGSVKIMNCSKLADFTGLKNALPSLSAQTWNVSGNAYNPGYDDMVAGKYTK